MHRKEDPVFSGKIIDVSRLEVTLPGGMRTVLDKVSHPGASIVVPRYRDRICLLRQYRGIVDEYLWELPAGKLSPDEDPALCAVRELKEETGLVSGEVEQLGFIYTSPGFADEKIFVFRTECTDQVDPEMDDDEVIQIHFFSVAEVKDMFDKGLVTDSKTISALAMAGIL